MFQRQYDEDIRKHYDSVAQMHKDSPASTMEDAIVRAKETECIDKVILGYAQTMGGGRPLTVADVGCGNGYTLSTLAAAFPENVYTGVEFTESLREIAIRRLAGTSVHVTAGDLRRRETLPKASFDVVVCQRVLINLMDPADQKVALGNILDLIKDDGAGLFIEAFQSGLDNLNAARAEFALPPVPSAHHNLYLQDDFFDHPSLQPWASPNWVIPPNLLSTHYYVTRVLHEVMLRTTGTAFARNSHFVKFWSEALPDGIGNFAPLKIDRIPQGRRAAGQVA